MTGVSCIYEGVVRHRRRAPRRHELRMRVAMFYLDLAEADDVLSRTPLCSARRWAPLRFRRADYLGDADRPLADSVRERLAQALDDPPRGPIRMLTMLRTWGVCFNPVTFYYAFDGAGDRVEAVVAEITNTPWLERHAYVLDARRTPPGRTMRFGFDKRFYVSPFMPMAQRYDWRFGVPADRLGVHMRNLDARGEVFDATLALRRRDLTPAGVRRILWRFPAQTAGVVAKIYWEALRLRLKGVDAHRHPSGGLAPATGGEA